MVNAAMYAIRKESMRNTGEELGAKFDIAQQLIPRLIDRGRKVGAYVTVEYLKDMGTPDRLKKVEADLSGDIPRSRRLGSTRRKAVFLDRDGTLNVDVAHLDNPEHLELILRRPKVSRCLISRPTWLYALRINLYWLGCY